MIHQTFEWGKCCFAVRKCSIAMEPQDSELWGREQRCLSDPLGCPDTSSPRLLQERCSCRGGLHSALDLAPWRVQLALIFCLSYLEGSVVHWWEAAKNEQAKSVWTCNVFQLWPLISLAATVSRLLLSETSSLMSILRHGLRALGKYSLEIRRRL